VREFFLFLLPIQKKRKK